jgi:hypothetical protein
MFGRGQLVARLVTASAGLSLLCSCGGTSAFGGGSAKQSAKEPNPASEASEQSSGATTADTTAAPMRADTSDGKVDDENEPATAPTQVSGAFLVGCSWQEDDSANKRGIVGCSVVSQDDARTLPASEVQVVSVTLSAAESSTPVQPMEGTEAHAIRFPIDYGHYGQEIHLDLQFKVLSPANGAADAPVTEVKDLSIAALPVAPPAEAVTASHETGAFILGDDAIGVGISLQCPSITTLVKRDHSGKVLKLVFEAQVKASFSLSFFRVCSNGSGGDGSTKLARWEVIDAKGNSRATDDIPASSEDTGAPQMVPATPTSTSVATIPDLEPGVYTLKVHSGVGNGDALDDSAIENLKIAGLGFVYKSLTFK